MPESVYTAGIIGTGRIGFSLGFDKKREQPASHSAALKANRRVRVVSGCDADGGRLEKWGKSFPGAKLFPEAEGFFAQTPAPDLVVVAVNEDAHLPLAKQALACGARLVILEKPVALNMREGLELKAAAEKSGAAVLVNHERRFARDYRLARSLILSGAIGEIQSVRAVLCSGLAVYTPDAEATGAYSLLHDGTHLIDTVHFLLQDGEKRPAFRRLENPAVFALPVPARARLPESGAGGQKRREIRNLSVFYQLEDGAQVALEISGRSRFFDFFLDITGTEGRIKIGNGFAAHFTRRESRLYTGFYSLEKTGTRFPKKTGYFSGMVENAVGFLDGREKIASTLDDGLAALHTIEEINAVLRKLCK